MITKFNKHKHKRDIDAQTKTMVRQRCGFGCIFCGNSIYQYEYIDPIYKGTSKHEDEKICLLCPACYQKVVSGKISKQQILDQYKKPIATTKQFSSDYLKITPKAYAVLGKVFFTNTSHLLKINGISILSISQPTVNEPAKLNAKFYDDNNKLILEIKDNETIGNTINWDIEQTDTRTIIRRNKGKILLQINLVSPDIFEIEKINMTCDSTKIYTETNKGKIFIRTKNSNIIDLSKDQVITQGLSVTNTGIVLEKPLTIGAKEKLGAKKLDYRVFIDTGKIQSE